MEKIKQYKWWIIALIAVSGIGIFLYLQTGQRAKVEVVTVDNGDNFADGGNGQASLPAESSVVEEKPDTKAEEQAAVPEPEKAVPVVPVEPPKKAEETEISGSIVKRLVNFGFQAASGRKIDTVIVHSSYNALGGDPFSVDKILDIYKSYGVAAHYLVDRKGTIYQLVEDKNIAYHAGVAKLPDSRTNVNEVSIGIEMINLKTDQYTARQYAALNKLLDMLKDKYKINYVLGHDQIAPDRKDDPWNFDWSKIDR